jgi:hypothetical protein
LYHRLCRVYGPFIAVLAVVLFASFTEVRWHTRQVMSDVLTLLWCMLAVFAIADFVMSRHTRSLLAAVLWSLLAFLTKENSLHLLIFLPAVVIIAGRGSLRRDWGVYAGILAVCAGGVGLLALRLLSGSGIHGFQGFGQLLSHTIRFQDGRDVLAAFFRIAPAGVFVLAALGCLANELRYASSEKRLHARLAAAWLLAIILFFLVVPAPATARYYMPALVALTMLFAHSLYELREWLDPISHSAAIAAPMVVCLVAAVHGNHRVPPGMRGFANVAQSIPVRPNLVTLISSDPFGEGSFVVERLMADRERSGIVLRASKVLSSSDWHGERYQLLKNTSDDIYAYLAETPVHYVVLDGYVPPVGGPSPDQKLLRQAIEEHPCEFVPVRSFQRFRGDTRYENSIVVYKNVAAKDRSPGVIHLDLRHTLRRPLELGLNASDK